jgi:DNA-binding MarR family transcriptional regulator
MMVMTNSGYEHDSRAIRLAVVIKRLRTSMQDAALAGAMGLSLSELLILRRLRLEGPSTAASLAAAEQVTHQAITQNLSELKSAGLVEAAPDPDDGRKKRITVTDAGNRLFESVSASRNAWLTRIIEAAVAESELPDLDKAIELLERLADVSNSGLVDERRR